MKKNLFYYLFAVICSVTLFTACSDDDEDTTWQQIPEITSDNVTLKLNNNTPTGATATCDIINGESAKVTLVNAIYGHPSVAVNVTLEKKSDTSYNFSGTAELEAARMTSISDGALKVTVSGTVDTAGKMTIDVVTSGWAAVSGVYANDSLAITFDGKTHSNDSQYAVTLTATENGSAATLVFKKIINVALDVEANVTLDNGKISGTVEPLLGYTITITGSVDNGKLTLDLVSSGYGTIAGSYSASGNVIKFNGNALTTGSATIKVLSATKAQIALGSMLVGGRTATIEDAVIAKEEGKEVYTLKGQTDNDDYTVTFKGTVAEDGKLTADVAYTVKGDIVGKWNLMKSSATMATPIFKFATTKGSVTLPESVLALIPKDMQQMFPATMPDEMMTQAIQALLGTYALYLQSVEFAPNGRFIATYIEMPKDTNGDGKIDAQDTVDTTPKTFAMLQYYMKDGQLYLAFDLNELMSMMSADKSRAWDPTSVLTEGIPVNYQISGDVLSVSLVTDKVVGLAGFANQMLPLIGMMLPEEMKAQFEVIEAIFGDIYKGIIPEVKELEVGLMFTK